MSYQCDCGEQVDLYNYRFCPSCGKNLESLKNSINSPQVSIPSHHSGSPNDILRSDVVQDKQIVSAFKRLTTALMIIGFFVFALVSLWCLWGSLSFGSYWKIIVTEIIVISAFAAAYAITEAIAKRGK